MVNGGLKASAGLMLRLASSRMHTMARMGQADSKQEINPYAPPQHDPAAHWPLLPAEQWPSLDLRVVNVTKGGLDRRVQVAGDIDAEIHYDGVTPPSETVRVNRVVRGRSSPWDLALISPFIEFTIDGDGYRLPARIDVKAGFSIFTLLRLARFKLTIAGRVLYEEP